MFVKKILHFFQRPCFQCCSKHTKQRSLLKTDAKWTQVSHQDTHTHKHTHSCSHTHAHTPTADMNNRQASDRPETINYRLVGWDFRGREMEHSNTWLALGQTTPGGSLCFHSFFVVVLIFTGKWHILALQDIVLVI